MDPNHPDPTPAPAPAPAPAPGTVSDPDHPLPKPGTPTPAAPAPADHDHGFGHGLGLGHPVGTTSDPDRDHPKPAAPAGRRLDQPPAPASKPSAPGGVPKFAPDRPEEGPTRPEHADPTAANMAALATDLADARARLEEVRKTGDTEALHAQHYIVAGLEERISAFREDHRAAAKAGRIRPPEARSDAPGPKDERGVPVPEDHGVDPLAHPLGPGSPPMTPSERQDTEGVTRGASLDEHNPDGEAAAHV